MRFSSFTGLAGVPPRRVRKMFPDINFRATCEKPEESDPDYQVYYDTHSRNPVRRHIRLSPEQDAMLGEVLNSVLLWDPKSRMSFKDLLRLPFFDGGPELQKEHILQREPEEYKRYPVDDIRNKIDYMLDQMTSQGILKRDVPKSVKNDALVMVLRTMSLLERHCATFDAEHVIRTSVKIALFLWMDWWDPNDMVFESELVNTLYLTKFRPLDLQRPPRTFLDFE